MKNAQSELSARYLLALRAHLHNKRTGNGDRAQGLGRFAVANGLVTRDLAHIHGDSMAALLATGDFAVARRATLQRARVFFAQADIPLDQIQRATKKSNRFLKLRNQALRKHVGALASVNRKLKREVKRRKAGEIAVLAGKAQYQGLFLESRAMQKKLSLLTRQIIAAQEEERKEISRELHDEVVQTLVGINVQLAALGSGASIGLRNLKSKIARTQRLVEKSVNAVHRFARELRPAVLDDLGLIPALHAYSRSLAARKKIRIDLTAFNGVEALGNAKRTVLYRVAQEALTNVARHSQATQVLVNIEAVPGAIRMEINDNGKSFDVEGKFHAKTQKRLGLIGMRERVEMVGGNLTIKSSPGAGTTVRAEIPFDRKGQLPNE